MDSALSGVTVQRRLCGEIDDSNIRMSATMSTIDIMDGTIRTSNNTIPPARFEDCTGRMVSTHHRFQQHVGDSLCTPFLHRLDGITVRGYCVVLTWDL